MNVCVFTGRPTKDIEIVTKNDKTTAFFSLAVSSGYGANKKTSFFNCVAYGKLAKSIEKNVKKGTKITIEAAAAATCVSSFSPTKRVWAQAPSDRLRMGCILGCDLRH